MHISEDGRFHISLNDILGEGNAPPQLAAVDTRNISHKTIVHPETSQQKVERLTNQVMVSIFGQCY